MAIVAREGLYGAINKEGNWVVSSRYLKIENFDANGHALAYREGHDYMLDKEGRQTSFTNQFNKVLDKTERMKL